MDLQHIARLVAAAAFFSMWVVRRQERPLLYVVFAYAGWALVGATVDISSSPGISGIQQLGALGPGVHVGFCLMSIGHVARRRAGNIAVAWAAGATLVATLVLLQEVSSSLAESAGIAAAFAASALLSIAFWRSSQSALRSSAVIGAIQAGLLVSPFYALLSDSAETVSMLASCALSVGIVGYEFMMAAVTRVEKIDEQTLLPTRRALFDELERTLRSLTPHCGLGVLVADIGGLRRLNGVLGRVEEDQLLLLTANRLRGLCELGTSIGRTGVSEFTFLVLAPRVCGTGPMERLADRIVAAMRQPIGVQGRDVFLRAHVGVHPVSLGSSAEEVFRLARLAALELESADGWAYFDTHIHERATRRVAIERCIRHALMNDEFNLVYQPIVCAQSARLCKVEALIRWTSAELGDVSPAEFIPIAESTGQIVEIGRWVLERACVQCAAWRTSNVEGLVVSVNVAAAQFQQVDFLNTLRNILECLELPPGALELELTEGALPLDSTSVERTLHSLRSLGVRLALDDFGTGFSSLSRLANMEFDTVKIDRSFVRAIEESERSRRLCEFACTLGRHMDLQVVAEGVETEPQARLLREFGVDHFQGYLFGKPMPPDLLAQTYLQSSTETPRDSFRPFGLSQSATVTV